MVEVKLEWGNLTCTECETCVCQTEVAYKKTSDNVWTIPATPDNPTTEKSYSIFIEEGVHYQARLTFKGPTCKEKPLYLSLYYPTSSVRCCPEGFTLSPDNTYCYMIDEVPANAPIGGADILVAKKYPSYGTCGTYLYAPGYNIDGTGPSTQFDPNNLFWISGTSVCGDNPAMTGPLNRCGVWSQNRQDNQEVGFSVCLDIPATKTYYIGMGSDNKGIIKLDGVTIVEQDAAALGVQYGVGDLATFKVWHIYPVEITSGPHILEIIGRNVTGEATIGCEVYDATPAELEAATGYGDLGGKLIFSSKDEVGSTVQIGTGGVGYTCPSGYSLASCESPYVCRKIFTVSTIDC